MSMEFEQALPQLDQALEVLRQMCATYTFNGSLADASQMIQQSQAALDVVSTVARAVVPVVQDDEVDGSDPVTKTPAENGSKARAATPAEK